jgi:hypothetical protein
MAAHAYRAPGGQAGKRKNLDAQNDTPAAPAPTTAAPKPAKVIPLRPLGGREWRLYKRRGTVRDLAGNLADYRALWGQP